jgi:hypothetical protein
LKKQSHKGNISAEDAVINLTRESKEGGIMFSKGKINIAIQKTSYVPGDIISGNVALTLKKPVKAREVSISLIGEEITTGGGGTVCRGGGRTSSGVGTMGCGAGSTRIERIYDFKQQLDGEKEYTQGREYRFEIKIPADIPVARHLRWYLSAKLDIPGALDINKKVDITIG